MLTALSEDPDAMAVALDRIGSQKERIRREAQINAFLFSAGLVPEGDEQQ